MSSVKGTAVTGSPRRQASSIRLLRQDAPLTADAVRRKLADLRTIMPMYVPSRQPVGKVLSILEHESWTSLPAGVERVQILPHRQIFIGQDSFIDARPLNGWKLNPGRLLTDGRRFHGYVSSTGELIADVTADFRASRRPYSSFTRMQRFPTHHHVGKAVSLITGAGGANNYCDWLYDVLPRFFLLKEADLVDDPDTYLVPPVRHEFQRTTLSMLGIPLDKCLEIDRPMVVEADEIVVSAGHRNYRHIEPWIPQFLRTEYMRSIPTTGRRIYVNRRDTKKRNIVNESQLEAALASLGFESVAMAEHSFSEKVRLFASADILVAAHGAGLANIAFCAPGTAVVEVKGDQWDSPIFEDVSRAIGLRHRAVPAGRTVSSPIVPAIERHIEVDVELVLETVASMI
jgi:hypothetical protein